MKSIGPDDQLSDYSALGCWVMVPVPEAGDSGSRASWVKMIISWVKRVIELVFP